MASAPPLAAAPAALGGVDPVVARLRALRWNLVTQQALAETPYTAAYFSGKTPGPEGEKTLLVQVTLAPLPGSVTGPEARVTHTAKFVEMKRSVAKGSTGAAANARRRDALCFRNQ